MTACVLSIAGMDARGLLAGDVVTMFDGTAVSTGLDFNLLVVYEVVGTPGAPVSLVQQPSHPCTSIPLTS
jgi:S1-C subfamily serine protease